MMVRSVGTPVDTAAALQPNVAVCPARMVLSQFMLVAVARFPACSVMTAIQLWTFDVGVVNVQRSVHPLIAGPLLVMDTLAVNPPLQEEFTVYVQVTDVLAAAGRAAASGISVAATISQRKNFDVMVALSPDVRMNVPLVRLSPDQRDIHLGVVSGWLGG